VNRDYQAKIYLFDPDVLQTGLGTSAFLDVLNGHQGMVTSLAFSPDGATLASSGYDLLIKFWDVAGGALLGQVSITDTPNFLAFSADGARLAVASNLEVTFIDSVSRQVITSVPGAGGNDLAFSPDGSRVYVNALGGIKMVDTAANQVTLSFPDPFALVPTLSVSPDGTVLGVTYETPETVEGFALSPDGSQIITHTMELVEASSSTENIRLATWDAKTGKYAGEVKFFGDRISIMRFSPNGKLLAMGTGSQVWIWDTATWQVTEKRAGHIEDIVDLAFTPEGGSLLSASRDGTVRVWSLDE
jgi:WD40 repeat protein